MGWAKSLAGGSVLAFAAVILAARVGVMPAGGYEFLYIAQIASGEHVGASHEPVVLGIYEANCRPFRVPRPIRWLANDRTSC